MQICTSTYNFINVQFLSRSEHCARQKQNKIKIENEKKGKNLK